MLYTSARQLWRQEGSTRTVRTPPKSSGGETLGGQHRGQGHHGDILVKSGWCGGRCRVDLTVKATGDGQKGGAGAHMGHEDEKGMKGNEEGDPHWCRRRCRRGIGGSCVQQSRGGKIFLLAT